MKLQLMWVVGFLLLGVGVISAQEKTVTGNVKDDQGFSLPGVTILVKGTTKGTQTDFDGNYSIFVKEEQTLVFSYVGMKTQEKKVSAAKTGKSKNLIIDVLLKPDAQELDAVVVTGFQKIDKRLFTGSAVKVNSEDIKLAGVSDVSRSLQGEVAGVSIENVSGTFGAAPIIKVRGSASINGNNQPLWVIDGVVLEDAVELSSEDLTSGNLNTILGSSTAGLNPEDIESFQILKDASATALYGARAMNGVVVITTKKGSEGRLRVDYTSNITVKQRPSYGQFDILPSGAEMSVYQELYEKGWIDIANSNTAKDHGVLSDMFYQIAQGNIGWGPNGTLNYDYLQHYADANTNWFKVLFKDGISTQHSLSFTTGSKKSTLRASLGILKDDGQTIADNVRNYTASIRADFNLTDDLTVGVKLSSNIRNQKLAASEDRNFNAISGKFERNFDINPFNYALYTARSITPYSKNGKRRYFRKNYAPFNILDELEYNKLNLNLSDITVQSDLSYKINKKLQLRTSLQARWYSSKAVQDINEKSNNANAYRADNPLFREKNPFLYKDQNKPGSFPYSVLPQGGFKKNTENGLVSYYMRNVLDYNTTFGSDEQHQISAMVGQEIRYNNRTYDYFEGWGYLFNKGGLIVTSQDFVRYLDQRGQNYFSYNETRNRSIGAFTSLGYSYDEKYIINGTFRYDGDNRTGSSRNARYLPTWNISGAWNIHKENFVLDNFKWINWLKLKATYGLTGDNPVNASAALLVRGEKPLRPHISDRETSLIIRSLENSELTYEKQYEFNVGIEVALFSNFIYSEVEYYKRHSTDLLGLVETNGVGGFGYKYGNIGEMEINGVDASLKFNFFNTDDFKWSSSLTYSYNQNKITKWQSRDRIGKAVGRDGADLIDYPKGTLFSIPFAGLDKNGVPYFTNDKGEKTYKINFQERENIIDHLNYEGPVSPVGSGGITNSLTYKNWNLKVSVFYSYGNKIRLDDAYYGVYSDSRSLPGGLIDRWQLPGDEKKTNIPAIIDVQLSNDLDSKGYNPYNMYNKSNVRVADGDFVRVKSLSLGYNVPKEFLKKTFIKSLSADLSGYNLWLLYSDRRLRGIDPEFYQSGGISLPMSSSYTLTFNLNF